MDCSDCLYSILRDLRKALKSDDIENEVKKILKKYTPRKRKIKTEHYLKAGHSYYVSEMKASLSFRIFKQVIDRGYKGMCITRTRPDELEIHDIFPDLDYYWLSTVRSEKALSPGDLAKILALIKDFLKEKSHGAVLIDGTESLVINNDFNKFIRFLQNTKDTISASRGILIIPMNFDAFSEKEKAIIQNELEEINIKR